MPLTHKLPRQSPEAQGVPSGAINSFVDAVQKQISELQSFMLLRHGAVVAEGWWSPYAPERPHMLFSLTKSFTSTAIGFAVAEKRLSVDDYVLSFFPDDAPKRVSKNLAAMQIKHLLSMSTGHDADTMSHLFRRHDNNWEKAFLARPVKYKPGTYFFYNTGASYMLSAIVQKVSGLNLLDYLKPRLLDPLGIENATAEKSPKGVCMGGFGMNMTTEDISRFGQFYLQKGVWEGKRLLPESWIEDATSFHIANDQDRDKRDNYDWMEGYGYQFWRCRHGAYRGDGAFGQYCVVMPEQDSVLAITGGVANMQSVLDLVWKHLLPELSRTAPLPANKAGEQQLKQKLSSLAFLPPQGNAVSSGEKKFSEKTYPIEPNDLGVKALSFDFSPSGGTVTVKHSRGKDVIPYGINVWCEGTATGFVNYPRLVASGMWSAVDTFVLTIRFYETPFYYTLAFHFNEDHLTVDGKVNVGFGPTGFTLASVEKTPQKA